MSNIFGFDSLKSKVKIKKEAKRLSVGELGAFIGVLNEALAESEKKARLQTEEKRAKDIAKISLLLHESGLTPDDLKSEKTAKKAGSKKRKTSKPVPAKYRLVVEGKEYLWSGRGRTPKKFQEHFNAGNSRESCIIIV